MKINLSELKYKVEDSGKPVFECPSCHELELRRVYIFNEMKEYETDDFECDNPDCKAEYSEIEEGMIKLFHLPFGCEHCEGTGIMHVPDGEDGYIERTCVHLADEDDDSSEAD